MTFGNPIVGGVTLVRPAIQSPNYIPGSLGWNVSIDGSAEFNNLIARGSIEAGGGNVRLNNNGLHVTGTGRQMDINSSAAFLARNDPDDGTAVQITEDGAFFSPQNPSPGGNNLGFGFVTAGIDNPGAANEAPNIVLQSPAISGKTAAFMGLRGQAANDANPDNSSNIDIAADQINLFTGATRSGFIRGEMAGFLLSYGPAASANIAVTYAKTYTNPPFPYANIDSGAGATSLTVARCTQRTNTGFNILIFTTDGTNRTFVNVPISWVTFEI